MVVHSEESIYMEMMGKGSDEWFQRVVLRIHLYGNDGKGLGPVVLQEG